MDSLVSSYASYHSAKTDSCPISHPLPPFLTSSFSSRFICFAPRLQQSPANADNFYDVLSKANITFVDPSLAVYGGYTSDDEDDEEDGDHDESRE